jgi:hypothetical protein
MERFTALGHNYKQVSAVEARLKRVNPRTLAVIQTRLLYPRFLQTYKRDGIGEKTSANATSTRAGNSVAHGDDAALDARHSRRSTPKSGTK